MNLLLHVYYTYLYIDEATLHSHIDFIPFTNLSKPILSTRVSLKHSFADQGITFYVYLTNVFREKVFLQK